ncbi:uncharacterized protein LOC105187429 isoform X2 [Harpegnathos saltator]|uniref:uncharacterized protein LOC105187429 isoform X2 n=1 Tax=Harpegnathos saltator TaxID=610380 RepID=UPI00058ECEA8|nr:uncharacterized protein LOC105187429 isoform X2 [Harpegnathos saltator]
MAYILSKIPVLYRAAYYKNIILGPAKITHLGAKITHIRNHGYSSPVKLHSLEEQKFKLKDKISDDYKLIYKEQKGSVVPIFKRPKFVSNTLFKINGRIVLLDRACFTTQAAREIMMYKAK